MHGMQAWVALPREDEETAPAFAHHDAQALPETSDRGVWARLIAGSAYGLRNEVKTFSPAFYLHAELAGRRADGHAGRACRTRRVRCVRDRGT